MEFNLPEWLFGWHQLLFMFYIFVSVIPTVAFIASNNEEVIARQPQLIFHLIGKVGLDIALVMGISGTAIAMMAHLLSDAGNTDSYLQSTYIVGTLLMGAYVTGVGFCMTNPEISDNFTYKLERRQVKILLTLITFVVCLQSYVFELDIFELWDAGWILFLQFLMFGVAGLAASLSGKPILRCFIESNVSVTFIWMALGIVFWFSEGGDYLSSRSNILVIARTLFVGCMIHIVLHYVSLLKNMNEEGKYTTKTWHFAEAASFFVFLVLAPVGLTEFSRESTDQAAIQKQHEAQQLEINQLKAQIKLLTEKDHRG